MLPSGLGCFLATWESKAEARSIRPPETGAAATNAYNTSMTTTDSYAARVAVKVAKATQGAMSSIASVRNLPMVNGARLSLAAWPFHGFKRSRLAARSRRAGCVSWRRE